MRATVIIHSSTNLGQLVRKWAKTAVAPRVAEGVRRGLDLAQQLVVGRIKTRRLNGVGPFPISQHKLGHRSRRLVRAFDTNRARVVNPQNIDVRVSMGSNVSYFGAHEFGFNGKVQVKAHTRENGAKVRAHLRHVRIPERAMVRTEIAEPATLEIYRDKIARAVVAELQN